MSAVTAGHTVGRRGWYVRLGTVEVILETESAPAYLIVPGWGWNMTPRRYRWCRLPSLAWSGRARWFCLSVPLHWGRLVVFGPRKRP